MVAIASLMVIPFPKLICVKSLESIWYTMPASAERCNHHLGSLRKRRACPLTRKQARTSCAQMRGAYDIQSRHPCLMNATERERIVVSVGGSLIVPDGIDTDFLIRFKTLVLDKAQQAIAFSIIAGGGKTARRYQEAANVVTPLSRHDLDWIGIHATRLNAQLLRNIFVGYAHQQVIKNPTIDIEADEPVIIAAGWQPGCSTD